MSTRREFIGTTTAMAAALTTSALGQTAQDTRKAQHDSSSSNPAQQNAEMVALNPNSNIPHQQMMVQCRRSGIRST